ncbi:hypothetical protein ACN9JG_04565 [Cereibacter azotoformans]|uniref:hypothetical protein n=1 Tax=Cereibacter azotoformans TaxID=43057 RepID=UPI0015D62CA8|nr:hypothetical protein [Cereibacter azotoformans]MBO4169183.1 hypothetical protein [Cereibacter azotoformans]
MGLFPKEGAMSKQIDTFDGTMWRSFAYKIDLQRLLWRIVAGGRDDLHLCRTVSAPQKM